MKDGIACPALRPLPFRPARTAPATPAEVGPSGLKDTIACHALSGLFPHASTARHCALRVGANVRRAGFVSAPRSGPSTCEPPRPTKGEAGMTPTKTTKTTARTAASTAVPLTSWTWCAPCCLSHPTYSSNPLTHWPLCHAPRVHCGVPVARLSSLTREVCCCDTRVSPIREQQ